MRRRDFLKLTASSAIGAVLFQACSIGDGVPEREFRLQSPRNIPEDALFGTDAWYASVCNGCPAGCGVIVRVFEGRAKKIEGNPNHPINQGAICPRGQAMLQDLYHPDRIQTPLRRTGERGSGAFSAISWDEALDELVTRITELRDAGRTNEMLMVTEPLSGSLRRVADLFMTGQDGQRQSFETLDQSVLREAVRRVFGATQVPTFDLENARFALTFGADFLHTWISPVQLARKFGAFRQGRPEVRGVLYHVEPRLSGTAATADRWIPVQPGTEGILAQGIARAIIDDGLASDSAMNAYARGGGPAQLPAVEDAAAASGVSPDIIRDIARRFATEGPSIAFGGGTAAAQSNGLFNLTEIYALNLLADNVNAEGGVRLNADWPDALADLQPDVPLSFTAWNDVLQRMRSGDPAPVSLLLLHEANPVYGLPDAVDVAGALANIPAIISFSRYLDETTAFADLVLPDNTALESWGSVVPMPAPGFPTVGFQQPVVLPFYETRAFGDVLLSVAEELGGDVLEALPWTTFQDVVREDAERLREAGQGNIAATDPEGFWVELLQTGVWMNEAAEPPDAQPAEPVSAEVVEPEFSGAEDEYPFSLYPFQSPALRAGEYANLPWLQALPDPITTATWSTWVEINPGLAREMDLETDDIVRLVTPQGSAEVPVYVNPAAPPDVIAVPMGQGHRFYGRYAEGRGINPLDLAPVEIDAGAGSLAWAATRVRLEPTGRTRRIPVFEGQHVPETPEDYRVIRLTPVDED